MTDSGVYRTTDEFLAEFVDPEDHAAVKAGAARMIAEHRADRRKRIALARSTVIKSSRSVVPLATAALIAHALRVPHRLRELTRAIQR